MTTRQARHRPHAHTAHKRSHQWSGSHDKDSSGEEYDVLHLESHPGGLEARHNSDGLDTEQRKLIAELTLPMYEADVLRGPVRVKLPAASVWRGKNSKGESVGIETDRFDAIHLLRAIPEQKLHDVGADELKEGMSDLDSDAEDVFFMEADDLAAYRQEKRQKELEELRRQRMEALEAKEALEEEKRSAQRAERAKQADRANNLSEEQFNLMQRTAKALQSAANPSTLTMKILANHGGNARFAFLRRGAEQRWADVWTRLMKGETLTFETAQRPKLNIPASTSQSHDKKPGVSLLAGVYASDSDSEDGKEESRETNNGQVNKDVQSEANKAQASLPSEDDETRRKRKLALAHEWARKRREKASEEKSRLSDNTEN